ncbi:trypsin-like peptidase domain-containing protein [Streptomyces sp. KLOTTS4A1]|uniref:trypsin-like peptidase domain-containing protein n=1 Tax=Streptomyces sp. KLOTTS4A1 TaxID=3390996 RepID=UPI0039F5A860
MTGGREQLVRICDLAGRPRGTGFAADEHGTILTSHEAVDGLARIVLHAPGGHTCVATPDDVTAFPEADLALVRTQGLGLRPMPLAVREAVQPGAYVRIAARGWREARVLDAAAQVTYTATDGFHLLDGVLELAVGTDASDALQLGGGAAGGPVLDAVTGAVLGVLGTALDAGHRAPGYAVSLHAAARADRTGALAALLERNAAGIPAYGRDLNLAGALQLSAISVGSDLPSQEREPVEREETARRFAAFVEADSTPYVLGLVGDPGSGRTTELAALARRRARGTSPAPTVWLRGASLHAEDASLADAVGRALAQAGRILVASEGVLTSDRRAEQDGAASVRRGTRGRPVRHRSAIPDEPVPSRRVTRDRPAADGRATREWPVTRDHRPAAEEQPGTPGAQDVPGPLGDIGPDRIARLVRDAGRPLLVLLDGPEEMPPQLAHRLAQWSTGTARWLRGTGAQLVVACRPEYWEQAGVHFPESALYGSTQGGRLPACVPIGSLGERQAAWVRALYGVPDGALGERDAEHPLAARLLGEVRTAQGEPADGRPDLTPDSPPDRSEIFDAYLDLLCLRIAVRLAAVERLHGTDVRRLAARVSGRLHEAARRCLGPGQGELDRTAFEEVFPWATGWASAVLAEGALVPAGTGYRFAHEELADWIQGAHLDLDPALFALVHRRREPPDALDAPPVAAPGVAPDAAPDAVPAPAGRPARAQRIRRRTRKAAAEAAAEAAPDGMLPVPRHRIGPVLQALLRLERHGGPDRLRRRLDELALAADDFAEHGPRPAPGWAAGGPRKPADAAWWAVHLLTGTLLRVPDARPYLPVLRLLADRIEARGPVRGVYDGFGPWFWRALPLPTEDRLDLLRRLVPTDPAPDGTRHLDAVADLLKDRPASVQPLLTLWFTDYRQLASAPEATVADAAQALLHTHRHGALDELTEALVDCAHPRGDELLATLAEEEPSALCRAVDRWAHDARPARRAAAATYGLRTAAHATGEPDRGLLRYAALVLLAAEHTLHGPALTLLVRDPVTRARHLPHALELYAAGDPHLPSTALTPALATHTEPVLAAFGARLHAPGPGAAEVLAALAAASTGATAHRVASLVRDFAALGPHTAAHTAGYVDRCLDQHGAEGARTTLLPLVTDLLRRAPAEARRELARVLAARDRHAARDQHTAPELRAELLDLLLTREADPLVLDEAMTTAVRTGGGDWEASAGLVRRCGLLLVRTPEGAATFDRRLVDLAHTHPGFARGLADRLEAEPGLWTALVGPSARRMIAGDLSPTGA